MLIDAATRANLELTATLSGERRGSLLAAIDRTVTGAGARLLARRLAGPSTDPALIDAPARCGRVDARRHRAPAQRIRDDARARAPDLARALSRLTLDRGGPRDLAAIRDGLAVAARHRRRSLGERRAAERDRRRASRRLRAAPAALVADARRGARRRPAASEARRRLRPRRLPRRARRGAEAARREPPRHRRPAGRLRRRDRHPQRSASSTTTCSAISSRSAPVHGERLLAPPLNARFIHRQTHGRRRALHHHRARRARGEDRRRRRAGARDRA